MRRKVGISGLLEGVSGTSQGGARLVLVVVGLIMSQACTAGPRERSPSTFYRVNLRRVGFLDGVEKAHESRVVPNRSDLIRIAVK